VNLLTDQSGAGGAENRQNDGGGGRPDRPGLVGFVRNYGSSLTDTTGVTEGANRRFNENVESDTLRNTTQSAQTTAQAAGVVQRLRDSGGTVAVGIVALIGAILIMR